MSAADSSSTPCQARPSAIAPNKTPPPAAATQKSARAERSQGPDDDDPDAVSISVLAVDVTSALYGRGRGRPAEQRIQIRRQQRRARDRHCDRRLDRARTAQRMIGYSRPARMPPSCGPISLVAASFTTGLALIESNALLKLSLSALEVFASTFFPASVIWELVRGALQPPPASAQS